MDEIATIELTHHPAGLRVLADIEYAPAITLNVFQWLVVGPFTIALGVAVIWTFTMAVAAGFRGSRTFLEIAGLTAIGTLLAWLFARVLRWDLLHAASGWRALLGASLVAILASVVAILASIVVAEYMGERKSGYPYFTLCGVLIVFVLCWSGWQHDRGTRPAMDEPHRENVAAQTFVR